MAQFGWAYINATASACSPAAVPGADPVDQTLASGTTGSLAVTFAEATGGSGTFGYFVSGSHISGSGATGPSGSTSRGPHTITGLEDGDIYQLICTATDVGGVTQAVKSQFVISVATASAGAGGAVVVAGVDPADQSLASGTTGSAAVTFAEATGGSGTFAYAVTGSHIVGSGATGPTGSTSRGPHTITGLEDGDIYQLICTATDAAGVTQKVTSQTVIGVAADASGWATLKDYDFTDVSSSAGDISSGTTVLGFSSSVDTLSMTVEQFASNTGVVTPTSGSGLVYSNGNAMGTTTATFDWISGSLVGVWDSSYAQNAPVALHFCITGVTYPNHADDGIFCGISSATAHNSGNARGWMLRRDSVATNEDRRVRVNSSNSAIFATVPIEDTRVLTVILNAGTIVSVMNTTGSTPPTPAIGAATTYLVGAASLNTLTEVYYAPTAYGYLSNIESATFTLTRLLVQRYQ